MALFKRPLIQFSFAAKHTTPAFHGLLSKMNVHRRPLPKCITLLLPMFRIISRMPDSISKAELLTAIDYPREAAEVAAKLRDGDLFARIQGLVPATSPAGLAISQIKERLQTGFRQ